MATKVDPLRDIPLHHATVLAKQRVTPGMIRLTLGGARMAGWQTTGIGDEYVRLFFPDAETGELVLPQVDDRGLWKYPEGRTPSHTVCYTVRAVRPKEIDVDFVIHEGGRASDWAQRIETGGQVLLGSPRGLYAAPKDATWQLFVCDETGLPALGRLLELLPGGVEACVVAEVSDASRRQVFESRAEVKIVWLTGGNGYAAGGLVDAVRAVRIPGGPVYAWVAAERKSAQPLRKYFRHELGWPAERYSVTSYWTDKLAEWNDAWRALDPAIKARIDDLWASRRDREEIADEVEETLAPFGL